MHRPPQNYLRTQRRSWALTQKNLAYLLGFSDTAHVSRYERHVRVPSLKTILAYEVIFGVPPKQLLRGMYEGVEEKVMQRAYRMYKTLEHRTDPVGARKLQLLKEMLARATHKPNSRKI